MAEIVSMRRLIYLSPADDKPTGGIKVIYRHAELMSELGVDAYVLHPFDTTFRCTWFSHRTKFLTNLSLGSGDFVIIPEIWASIFGPQCLQQGVRYAIFVQNGYLTHPIIPVTQGPTLGEIYAKADLVFTISEDSSNIVAINHPSIDPENIVRVRYSVSDLFSVKHAPTVARTITFMPRKMAPHSDRVVFALQQYLPKGWTIVAIDGLDEAKCAETLQASSIFLAFSEFEGLPLPPLEAALSGNVVVGYTGQGAREYWLSPNFLEIHQGNITKFVEVVRRTIRKIELGSLSAATLKPIVDRLASVFSASAERANIETILARISGVGTA